MVPKEPDPGLVPLPPGRNGSLDRVSEVKRFDALRPDAVLRRFQRIWPHLRTVLILLHVTAMIVISFPAPVGGTDRSMWRDRSVQEELGSWAKLLHVDEPKFEDWLFHLTVVFMNGRDRVMVPFDKYIDWTGCDQPWRMFVAPHRYPARLQIQVHKSDAAPDVWTTLYEERSPDFRWKAEFFSQERVRSQVFRWGWPMWNGEYRWGCQWAARQAFAEDRDAAAVRCRFWREQSPTAAEVLAHVEPVGEWTDVYPIQRPR